MVGSTAKRAGLSTWISNATACAASSVGPAAMAVANFDTVCMPASPIAFWFEPSTKVGASLTALTEIAND